MKFVLAFFLLISIFCQIGRGNCAPADYDSSIVDGIKNLVTNSINYFKHTVSEISSYIPESVKGGYSNIKDGLGDMVEGAGDMVNGAGEMAEKAADNVEDIID